MHRESHVCGVRNLINILFFFVIWKHESRIRLWNLEFTTRNLRSKALFNHLTINQLTDFYSHTPAVVVIFKFYYNINLKFSTFTKRFKFQCCTSKKYKTMDCSTKHLNAFQQELKFKLPRRFFVLTGLYSYHRNDKEYVLIYICFTIFPHYSNL